MKLIEKYRRNCHEIRFDNDSLNVTPKVDVTKAKMNKC
jgi:hypothetical protein